MSDAMWWQEGVIYQIYPRSFQDTNGDGIGDLPGIRQRLDYLAWLGVDAIWISPIYPSPMADFGYDVSDYTAIHPMFGTMADFDALLAEAHARGLRVILDLVPNHTSDQHPWFVESRSSRDNPKRDWYLWRDPAPDGGPPNNWLSVFGGGGWAWDEATGQYYYHAFLPEQPDLNWRHPEVQQAILDVMRFWLDRGVDGFRVDVMWHLIKDAQFRDNPPNPDYRPGEELPYNALLPVYSTDQPEVHDSVAMMRRLTNEYLERVIIGEVYLPVAQLVRYYGEENSGAHLPFNFELVLLPWDAEQIYAAITQYEASLPEGGWPNWVLSNHDQPRVATRVGAAQARVAAMLLLTLKGTPTLYYGDELEMEDVAIPPEAFRDPQGINTGICRDPARTPMLWDASPSAGFTTGTPWLPVSPDYATRNVAAQRDDPGSMLTLVRQLLALRRRERALAIGDYAPVAVSGTALAYTRTFAGRTFLIALNLGEAPASIEPPHEARRGRVALGTDSVTGRLISDRIELGANEGIVVLLDEG